MVKLPTRTEEPIMTKFNELFYYSKSLYLTNSGIMFTKIKMINDVRLYGVFTSTVIPFDHTRAYGQIEFKKDDLFESCFLSEKSGSLLFMYKFEEMKVGRLIFPTWQPPPFVLTIKNSDGDITKIVKGTKMELIKIAIQEVKNYDTYKSNKIYLMNQVESFLNEDKIFLFKHGDYRFDIFPI